VPDADFNAFNYKVLHWEYRGADRYTQLQDELNRLGKGGAQVVYANIEDGEVNTGGRTPDPKIIVTAILMARGAAS
jgi:hypothetical protein